MIIGKARNFRTGLIRELTIPSTALAIKRSIESPKKAKPGTNRLAMMMAKAFATI